MHITPAIAQQLEAYSQLHPEEVLLITTLIDGEEDQVMIFKGFSSSLTRPTDFNPDNPVFDPEATFVRLDRARSPFIPDNPLYLQQDLSWESLQRMIATVPD